MYFENSADRAKLVEIRFSQLDLASTFKRYKSLDIAFQSCMKLRDPEGKPLSLLPLIKIGISNSTQSRIHLLTDETGSFIKVALLITKKIRAPGRYSHIKRLLIPIVSETLSY